MICVRLDKNSSRYETHLFINEISLGSVCLKIKRNITYMLFIKIRILKSFHTVYNHINLNPIRPQ